MTLCVVCNNPINEAIDPDLVVPAHPICLETRRKQNWSLRDCLRVAGKIVKDTLNYEEYEFDGVVYCCGWTSPNERLDYPGGWITYRKAQS